MGRGRVTKWEELEAEGCGEEADGRQLLVVPAGSLEVVGDGAGDAGEDEIEGCGAQEGVSIAEEVEG